MKRIIVVIVNNESGVLNRVTGMMMKRQFNIESMTVGYTERPGISKMTFTVNVEDAGKIEQLLKQLQKQIDVLKVYDITDQGMVVRELAFVKVTAPPAIRNEVYSMAEPFRPNIIDVSRDVVTFQVVGGPEKIEAFIELMKPYGVKELTRTGTTAFVRETQKTAAAPVTIL